MHHLLRGKRSTIAMAGALCLAAVGFVAAPTAAAPTAAPAPTVPTLNWQACDDGFSCATATVPLDYAHPAGATINVAMIKHPATDPAHRLGSVFYNPGGPGGSGLTLLPVLYSLFPPAVRARFDLVSFDPRGIGKSAALQCFDSNEQEQQLIGADETRYPTSRAEQRSFERDFAAFDAACAAHAGPLLAHDTTANVARDLDLMRQAVDEPALNYIGTSYGTYLGATYANLFPTKVRAMVLDGNADPVAWATGTAGSANALGTLLRMGSDRGSADTLDQFLTLCGRATTGSCAFSAGSPAATHTKLNTLLDRLASRPITVNGQTFTESATVHALVSKLYNTVPIANLVGGWPEAADFLQSLWDQTSGATPTFPKARPGHAATPNATASNAAAPYSGLESIYGVLCSDSPNPRNPAEFAAQADFAAAHSGAVGPYWAWIAEPCAQWPVLSADRYTGPWNTPTARPILVVGNTFDPSTRYRNSVTMAHDLGNARLLTLNGYGHTAQANPSACVNQAEDDYFVTGTLPPPGTVCQQDQTPFAG